MARRVPSQASIVADNDPVSVVFDLAIVRGWLRPWKFSKRLQEVTSPIHVMIADDQFLGSIEGIEDFSRLFFCEVAKVAHDFDVILLANAGVPVSDQGSVHILHVREW